MEALCDRQSGQRYARSRGEPSPLRAAHDERSPLRVLPLDGLTDGCGATANINQINGTFSTECYSERLRLGNLKFGLRHCHLILCIGGLGRPGPSGYAQWVLIPKQPKAGRTVTPSSKLGNVVSLRLRNGKRDLLAVAVDFCFDGVQPVCFHLRPGGLTCSTSFGASLSFALSLQLEASCCSEVPPF